MVGREREKNQVLISTKDLWDAGIRKTVHQIFPVRTSVEFFMVIENIAGFFRENVPSEIKGVEWALLLVKKEGKTTQDILHSLFNNGFNKKEVGYAGLKDKRSISFQWISVPSQKRYKAIEALTREGFKVLGVFASRRKIKPAKHSWNIFLALVSTDRPKIFERNIKSFLESPMFPNYFGFQRFGFHNDNLHKIWENPKILKGRNFLVDVFRSYIFNICLSRRIPVTEILPGDFVRFFSPTGPIYGEKMPSVGGFERDLEEDVFEEHRAYLQHFKKSSGWRRPYFIRIIPKKEIQVKKLDSKKYFIFAILPKGAFFSTLLFELSRSDITWFSPSSSFSIF